MTWYDSGAKRFVIYADRRLRTPAATAELKAAFRLENAETIVMSDLHYP